MKTYRVEIPEGIVARSFERALSYPEHSRGTFFHDLRRAFKAELETVFVRHGVLVNRDDSLGYVRWQTGTVVEKEAIISKYNESYGTEFCAKYGFDDYSLKAINYTERSYCELPSYCLLPE